MGSWCSLANRAPNCPDELVYLMYSARSVPIQHSRTVWGEFGWDACQTRCRPTATVHCRNGSVMRSAKYTFSGLFTVDLPLPALLGSASLAYVLDHTTTAEVAPRAELIDPLWALQVTLTVCGINAQLSPLRGKAPWGVVDDHPHSSLILHGTVPVDITLSPLPDAGVHPTATPHVFCGPRVAHHRIDDLVVLDVVLVINFVETEVFVRTFRVSPAAPVQHVPTRRALERLDYLRLVIYRRRRSVVGFGYSRHSNEKDSTNSEHDAGEYPP